MMAALVVALLSVTAVMAKDIRTAVFKTNVDKLKAGFKKFNYEAEFVKESKQEDKK